jgi:hypothetical protein
LHVTPFAGCLFPVDVTIKPLVCGSDVGAKVSHIFTDFCDPTVKVFVAGDQLTELRCHDAMVFPVLSS